MKAIIANQEFTLTAAESELIRNLRIIGDDEEIDFLIRFTSDRIAEERASKQRPALRIVAGGGA